MMSRLVPKLRFKEFSGEWEEKRLGDIGIFSKGKGIPKNDIVEDGVLECIRYGELYTEYKEIIKDIKSKTNLKKDSLILSKKNDVIIPSSGETYIDIATASCVLKDNIALGGDLNILRSKENGVFLAYYLSHVKKQDIAKLAQGIAVVHLYTSQLKLLKVELPKPKEQQKIANCLTSLDNLIEAQNKKVEALKNHKKGLMQRLFPKDGEKVPELRFDGFFGGIPPRMLKEVVVSNTYGPRFNANDYDINGNVKTIRGTDISFNGNILYNQVPIANLDINFIKSHILEDGDLVMITTADCGLTGIFEEQKNKYICSAYAVKITLNKTLASPHYFKYFFQTEFAKIEINKLIRKATVANLPASDILKITLKLPSKEEQQKIANCFSSLDNLIEAQNKKIEALKKHKKGLMQRLFMSSEG
jgi:type I restriction enzyme S subunit